ncbi:MAG: PAS domain-containing protein [Verrucomicrobia bacterium]|nr:PAS domain-containing protein [Verrucomicrobiota bacterium]
MNPEPTDRSVLANEAFPWWGLFEGAPHFLCWLERDGRILRANRFAVQLAGVSLCAPDRSIWECACWRESERTCLQQMIATACKGAPARAQVELQGSSELHVLDLTLRPIGTKPGEIRFLIAEGNDVTEQTRMRFALQESQEMLRLVLDNIPQGVVWKDRQSRYLGCNRVVAEAMNLDDPSEIVGKRDCELPSIRPQEAATFFEKDQEVMSANEPRLQIEETLTLPSGQTIWLQTNKVPLHDVLGRVIGVLGTWEDITQRKAVELVVQEREQLFRSTFEQAAVGIAHVSLAGKWQRVNRRWCELLGLSEAELKAHSFEEVIHPEDPSLGRMLLGQVLTGQIPTYDLEKNYIRPDDSEVWTHLTTSLIRDEEGQPQYLVVVLQDISDRKRADERLRISEERYSRMVDSISEGLWEVDLLSGELYRSKRCGELLGLPVHERKEDLDFLLTLVHPDEGESLKSAVREHFDRQTPFDQELRLKTQNREYRWFRVRGQAIRDDGGRPIRFAGSLSDVTENKVIADALRESEDRYSRAVEGSSDGLWDWDVVSGEDYFSPRWKELLGFGPEELENHSDTFFSRVHPEDVPRVDVALKAHFENHAPYNLVLRLRTKSGLYRWFWTRGQAEWDSSGKPRRMAGSITDISAQREAEEALQATQASLVEAQRLARLGSWVWDQTTDAANWSEQMYQLFEVSSAELAPSGAGLERFFSAEDWVRLEEALKRTREEGVPHEIECQIRLSNGQKRWVLSRGEAVRNAEGTIVGMRGTVQDIAERKVAEERLRQQVARMRLVNQITHSIAQRHDLESILLVALTELEANLPIDLDVICLFDPGVGELRVEAMGPRSRPLNVELDLAERAIFPSAANGLESSLQAGVFYQPDLRLIPTGLCRRLAERGLRSVAAVPLERNGRTLGLLLAARKEVGGFSADDCEFLKQLSEQVFLAAHHAQLYQNLQRAYDDLRQSQKTLLQQERLRALGQMATGIAHDINNAISPIALYTESLLEREPNLSPGARENLKIIRQAIQDVSSTVERIREFYRPREESQPTLLVDLNEQVRRVSDLTRARWRDQTQRQGTTISLRLELDPTLPTIVGVESEIREALTNLIFNAIDAMPTGGTLTLRTQRAARKGGVAKSIPVPSEVLLEVGDTGVGMDEKVRRHCLEPFFTTKGERGTGLGLAMVYGTMQRHSGEIEVISQLGEGTRIQLWFPTPPLGTVSAPEPPASPGPTNSLRLLVVDDDAMLGKSLQDALEGDGHHVKLTGSGKEGLSAFESALEQGEPFAVVITDLGMPEIDGRQVAQAVKRRSPQTPVILLTGWGHRMQSEGDIPPGVDRLLAKPTRLRDLREALAALEPEPG